MRRRPDDDLPVFRRLYCDRAVFIRYGNNRITPYDVPSFVLFLSTGRRREERDQGRKRKREFRTIMNFHCAPTAPVARADDRIDNSFVPLAPGHSIEVTIVHLFQRVVENTPRAKQILPCRGP